MKEICLCFILIYPIIFGWAQQQKNEDTVPDVIHIRELEPFDPFEEDCKKHTIPTKRVYFNLRNKGIRDISVYLYCPEMEDPQFSWEALGTCRNNLSGHNNNLIRFFIPGEGDNFADIPQSALKAQELLIRSSGHEIIRHQYAASDSVIDIKFEPITEPTIIRLDKNGIRGIYNRFTEALYPKCFYGICGGLTDANGFHVDIDCSYGGYADCNPFLQESELREVLEQYPELLKKLYRKTKKTGTCSFLVTIHRNRQITVTEEYPAKDKFSDLIQAMEKANWNIYPSGPVNETRLKLIFLSGSIAEPQKLLEVQKQ